MLRIENYYYVCMCFTGLPPGYITRAMQLSRFHSILCRIYLIPEQLDPGEMGNYQERERCKAPRDDSILRQQSAPSCYAAPYIGIAP